MFQVSNLTATTKEYLEEAEQKAMEETQQLGLDTKRFKEFCEGICVFHGIVNSISPKRDRGFTKA